MAQVNESMYWMTQPSLNILMYHSISEGEGPTCIRPDVFRHQMRTLQECGYQVVRLADVAAWLQSGAELPARSIVLTFDDGFEDFATTAFPELHVRGWSATVFLPTAKVGGVADWDSYCSGRKLMSWDKVKVLAGHGIDFGGHGVHHADLTALTASQRRDEIAFSRQVIEENIGRPVVSFAAPFGRTNAVVRTEIRRHYQLAVGTTFARAGQESDLSDLPRIEMWYFRDVSRWRAYLLGAQTYFTFRQMLRRARALFRVGRSN